MTVHKPSLIGIWIIGFCFLGWFPGKVLAQKIPAFEPIPTGGVSEPEKAKFNQELAVLQAKVDALQLEAKHFNAESAEQQTQKQLHDLQKEKDAITHQVLTYNREVDICEDTSVVDTRGAEEPVSDMGAEIENSPAVREAHKGYKCVEAHDWPAALAWFQQGLVKDPKNKALWRLASLGTFTIRREKEWAAETQTANLKSEREMMTYLFPDTNEISDREIRTYLFPPTKTHDEAAGVADKALDQSIDNLIEKSLGQMGKANHSLDDSKNGNTPATYDAVKEMVKRGTVRAACFWAVGDKEQATIDLKWCSKESSEASGFQKALQALENPAN